MKKVLFILTMLCVAVFSTACINNVAVEKLNNAAKIYMEKGDYTSAIQRLESSLELDKTVYQTYYNLGVAYVESKQYQKAIDALTSAINLNPKYADSYYTLAIAQEGYADSFVEDNEEGSVPVLSPQNPNVSAKPVDKYKGVSDSTKKEMINYYLLAIQNYQLYIDLINSSQKTEGISARIEELQKELKELGYTESDF